jgi:hypothetical protein
MASSLSQQQRDFMLLTIFVLARHGYIERAGILVEALLVVGENTAEVLVARAVIQFFSRNWSAALMSLDEVDRIAPIERFGGYVMTDAQRMRRYMKARCLHEMNERRRARDVVESYLRRSVTELPKAIAAPGIK